MGVWECCVVGGTLSRAFSCYAIVPITQTLPVSCETCLTQVHRACSLFSQDPLRCSSLGYREWAPSPLSMRVVARKGGRRPHRAGSNGATLPGCRWPEIRPPAQSEDLNLAVPLHHSHPYSFFFLLRPQIGDRRLASPKHFKQRDSSFCLLRRIWFSEENFYTAGHWE